MYKYPLVIGFITIITFTVKAQSPYLHRLSLSSKDAFKNKNEVAPGSFGLSAGKEKKYYPDSLHKSHAAVVRSLMLPGLGQLYNHRWWKIPIVYGGLGFLGSAVIYNQKNYAQLIAVYRLKHYLYSAALTSPQNPNHALYVKYKTEYGYYQGFSDKEVGDLAESWRRNRDICTLGVAAMWAINAIDAYIDAKFINTFSIDNNLAVKPVSDVLVEQVYGVSHRGSFNPGIKITFAIR
ncbi:DUF5683 domain-containing protein [Mucilaginibacter sp.]|uniref:DUF5683 domain-containing protein n=1 Tax=Mucilaginibacter sp. TaxID=1882438 RepID=UPI0025F4E704|nr:DUF5683 domain-containing protein [Mucilaginibacter sp.]